MDPSLSKSMGLLVEMIARLRVGITADPHKPPQAVASVADKRRFRKLWRMALARSLREGDRDRGRKHVDSILCWLLRELEGHGLGEHPNMSHRQFRAWKTETSDEFKRVTREVARELGLLATDDARRSAARNERRAVRAESRRRRRRRRATKRR